MFDPVNYTVSVYENSPMGTPLVNVTATDADSGQNAKITYSVTGGDPYSVFTVDTQVHQQRCKDNGVIERRLRLILFTVKNKTVKKGEITMDCR